jgi:S-DNA-T family DNA segregation ATPase FtsK/SpoIIIE
VDRCDGCGFDYYAFPRHEVPGRLRALAADHVTRLEETPAAYLRERPLEGWSALEYACHVRDVLLSQRTRIQQALVEDQPEFVPMGRDELPALLKYNEQPPDRIATELTAAVDALAGQLEGLDELGWARAGVYGYPTRELRPVDWIGRHTVHELHHHLGDVDRVLLAVLEG